jgi:hypothetical protein
MNSDRIKQIIREHAAEIVEMNKQLHETRKQRELSPEKWNEWLQLYSGWYQRYIMLAFPGGLEGAYERIVAGAPEAMEAAICFLEVRPYFFRSGYMFKDIFRKCKRAPLTPKQAARFEVVKERLAEWKRLRKLEK